MKSCFISFWGIKKKIEIRGAVVPGPKEREEIAIFSRGNALPGLK